MKRCDYCGRENSDDAVHCGDCGTTEFVDPSARLEHKQVGFLISKRTKLLFIGGALATLVLLIAALRSDAPRRTASVPQVISFRRLVSTGAGGFSFDISNQTDRPLVYLVDPPQVLSNGEWVAAVTVPPAPRRMAGLMAAHTATLNAQLPTNLGMYRIPIQWGYQPSFGVGHWAWAWVKKRFTGRNDGYRLETYTNFSEGISVP